MACKQAEDGSAGTVACLGTSEHGCLSGAPWLTGGPPLPPPVHPPPPIPPPTWKKQVQLHSFHLCRLRSRNGLIFSHPRRGHPFWGNSLWRHTLRGCSFLGCSFCGRGLGSWRLGLDPLLLWSPSPLSHHHRHGGLRLGGGGRRLGRRGGGWGRGRLLGWRPRLAWAGGFWGFMRGSGLGWCWAQGFCHPGGWGRGFPMRPRRQLFPWRRGIS